MEIEKFDAIKTQLTEMAVQYGPKLLGAIAVLIIGSWVIKALTKGVTRMLTKSKADESLIPFTKGLVNTLLKVLLVISVLGMIGIEMTSFIAILGAVGLAVGLALSGALQNFAGGVMILVFKPFKKGDFIQAQGHMGSVNEIQIFNTILKTPDNKTIIIPNGGLSTSSMTNFSAEQFRRVDLTFGMAYGESIEKAKSVIHKVIAEDDRILQDPAAPFVEVAALADSSVNFAVRLWVDASNYWGVFFSMNERIYNEFNKENISIPFPQMDVHVTNN